MSIFRAECGCWFFEWGSYLAQLWHSDGCRCGACGEKVCRCDAE